MTITDDQFVDPTVNPAASNAMVASLLNEASASVEPLPTIDPPADDTVPLPGGVVREEFGAPDVLVTREAQVRELNGADEEVIAKAQGSGSAFRYAQALIQCGTVRLGNEEPTGDMLKDMLIGDRDALVLGIRQVTYGNEIEIPNFRCPGCQETFTAVVDIDKDIPVRELSDPVEDRRIKVPLRKGGYALVRFPNGHDMEAALDPKITTEAERNSIFLTKCIQVLVNKDGDEDVVAGNRARANQIGLVDRRNILRAIKDKQPGPQYDDVKVTHSCGREIEVFLNLGDLFRDL